MREVTITTPEELIRELNELPNHYIYRGHADSSWKLQSSLERVLDSKWNSSAVSKFEDYSINEFKARFRLYDRDNIVPDSKLAWLSVMQHHGVPTRLIDFTVSPYVALYFALEAYKPSTRSDLAIFAVDNKALMELSIAHIKSKDAEFATTRESLQWHEDKTFDQIVDRGAYDIAWVTEPNQQNKRMDRQGGCFMLSGNRDMRIEEVLRLPLYASCRITKFTVRHTLYEAIYALLRKMNLNSKALYGDLDGLARSIRMQMQIYGMPDDEDV